MILYGASLMGSLPTREVLVHGSDDGFCLTRRHTGEDRKGQTLARQRLGDGNVLAVPERRVGGVQVRGNRVVPPGPDSALSQE